MDQADQVKPRFLIYLGALDNPTQGDAMVLGNSVKSLSHKDAARLRNHSIGFIFQTYNLLPVYSVFENVEFPLLLLKKEKEEREDAVMKALSWVGLTNKAKSNLTSYQAERVSVWLLQGQW